ncbi:MAG: hypothetical protein NUV69_01860 [Candidatus Curtissbacteria bacterium]|nr:hypothetical protein [Candidatus Curtissbacteria bacterium]
MRKNINVYIDIDGVILTKGVIPALHLDEFLKYILHNYSVFWLTSRSQPVKYLSQFLDSSTISLLQKVQPTNFRLDKTEAINFSKRFFWLECEIFASELNMLNKHGEYKSWIEVNLMKNPNQLRDLMKSKLLTN